MKPETAVRSDWNRHFENAALDPSLWMRVLSDFADATGSARAELVGVGPQRGQCFSWVTSVDERMMRDFVASGGHSPSTNFRIAADDGQSVLQIVDERKYDRVKPSLSSDDFVDFCEQQQMVHGCQTVLVREQNCLVGLSVLRTRAEGRTGEKEQKAFAAGARAAARAVRLQSAIEGQGHHLLAGTFEAMSKPCLLIDGFGMVRSLTESAEHALAGQDLVAIRNGVLSSCDRILNGKIGKATSAAIGDAPVPYARIAVGKCASQFSMEFFAVPQSAWAMPFAVRALVVIKNPGQLPADACQRLVSAFDLTPAEAEVATMLCGGVPRAQIAVRRGVSTETLRSQLRALYSKFGCNREVELVLLARAVLE